MKPLQLLSLVFFYLVGALPMLAQSKWQWADAQPFTVQAVATDLAGNAYVTGQFSGTITVGKTRLTATSTTTDLLVARFSPQGKPEWVTTLGATPVVTGTSSSVTGIDISVHPLSGESYVLGGYTGNISSLPGGSAAVNFTDRIVILKLSADGAIRWGVRAGNEFVPTLGSAIASDLQGNSYVTGICNGGFVLDDGTRVQSSNRSLYVLALNNAGQYRWSLGARSTLSSAGIDIGADARNGVYMLGRYFGPLTVGSNVLPSSAGGNCLLAKLSQQTGAVRWITTGTTDGVSSLVADALGNSYVAGSFRGTIGVGTSTLTAGTGTEGFVARFTSSGAVTWLRSIGQVVPFTTQAVCNLSPVPLLQGAVVGLTRPPGEAAVVALQPTGAVAWEENADGTSSSKALAVAPGPSLQHLRIFLGGTLTNQVAFGPHRVKANGTTSFLAVLSNKLNRRSIDWNVFSLFPNPVRDVLTLRLPPLPATQVQLLNLHGRVVRTMQLAESTAPATQLLEVRDLPSGLYLLRLSTTDETITRQIQIR
ncbi:T9SS type A sorting domain-containing protein [Hymenobacter seoulensis]